jgi:transposase
MIRYVGLDVHKVFVQVCILDRVGKRLFQGQVACTRQALTEFATTQLQRGDRVALESSTRTWAVVSILEGHVKQVVVSNPLKTKVIAEAKIKTDKVDAEVLAQLLRCNYLPTVWQPDAATRELRRLTSQRAALVVERTRIRNRIRGLLSHLLIEPPTARLWTARGMAWLRQAELPSHERAILNGDLALLEAVAKQLEELEQMLAAKAYHDDQVRLLMTLPGIDFTVAQGLLAALGDISRFADGDHAAAFLGLTPSTRQSGNHCYHGPITKAGRSHARWLLTQAAQRLDRNPGPLGVFFRRLARKKNRNVAVVAAARKLVTIALLMLKNHEPYRYAVPETTSAKLARLRFRVTHTRRALPRDVGQSAAKTKPSAPALSAVYAKEELPPATEVERLPQGEQRHLRRLGLTTVVRQMQQGQSPRTTPSRKAKTSPVN